jgi:hypothetical protein
VRRDLDVGERSRCEEPNANGVGATRAPPGALCDGKSWAS